MDEVAPNAEHESIATSLELEQLDKNLLVFPLKLSFDRRKGKSHKGTLLGFDPRLYGYPKGPEGYLVDR